MKKNIDQSYLIPNRLADVIRLICVLAVEDKQNFEGEESLKDALEGAPDSANNWIDIARAHPEFFRFFKDGETITLLFRYITKRHKEKGEIRPILASQDIQYLISLAVDLHDKQLARNQRNSYKVAISAAYITAIASIVTALIALYSNNDVKSDLKDIKIQIEKNQNIFKSH